MYLVSLFHRSYKVNTTLSYLLFFSAGKISSPPQKCEESEELLRYSLSLCVCVYIDISFFEVGIEFILSAHTFKFEIVQCGALRSGSLLQDPNGVSSVCDGNGSGGVYEFSSGRDGRYGADSWNAAIGLDGSRAPSS